MRRVVAVDAQGNLRRESRLGKLAFWKWAERRRNHRLRVEHAQAMLRYAATQRGLHLAAQRGLPGQAPKMAQFVIQEDP